MYPLSQVTNNMLYLPNFTWQIDICPTSKDDIFRQPKRLTQADVEAQKQELKAQEQEERKNKRKQKNQDELLEKL